MIWKALQTSRRGRPGADRWPLGAAAPQTRRPRARCSASPRNDSPFLRLKLLKDILKLLKILKILNKRLLNLMNLMRGAVVLNVADGEVRDLHEVVLQTLQHLIEWVGD